MINVILCTFSLKYKSIQYPDSDGSVVKVLHGYLESECEDCYFVCNGRKVDVDDILKDGCIYHAVPRILGGKGGFGSMLRAIGSQIQKTTNNEACRDLSGRRMRDVNNEKKLKEWVEKRSDREKEKAKKEEERREKRQAFLKGEHRHMFDDPDYHKQKMQVTEELEDALQMGLSSKSGPQKRKSPDRGEEKAKRACEWFGVEDMSDFSDSDISEEGDCDSNDDMGDGMEEYMAQQSPDRVPLSSKENMTDINKICEHEKTMDKEARSPSATVTSTSTLDSESVDNKEDAMDTHIDLMTFNHPSELEALGLDRLKSLLMDRGMKCGGTLEQRAHRLWMVRGKDHIDPSLLAIKKKGKN